MSRIMKTKSEYYPDKWVVVRITREDSSSIYKVFACWYGGYLNGDSWKLNSGITNVTLDQGVYAFHGSSGSVYHCGINSYGTNTYGQGVLNNLMDKIQKIGGQAVIMPENTNWLELSLIPHVKEQL